MLFTNALVLAAGAMLGPIYALFVEQVGGDLMDASLTGGVFALAAGITTILAGRYADRIKENELIIVFGYVLMGIGFLLMTKVNSIWFLFGTQALIGFAEAVYSPAFDAVYSKHLPDCRRGKYWGAWEAVNYFMAAAGAFAGGFLVYHFGFDFLFIIMAILAMGSAVYIYFLPRKVL